MSAEASIQVEKKENVLMLPIDAVQSVGNRYMVYAANRQHHQHPNRKRSGGWRPTVGPSRKAPAGSAPGAGQGADATTAAPTGGAPAAGQAANRTAAVLEAEMAAAKADMAAKAVLERAKADMADMRPARHHKNGHREWRRFDANH